MSSCAVISPSSPVHANIRIPASHQLAPTVPNRPRDPLATHVSTAVPTPTCAAAASTVSAVSVRATGTPSASACNVRCAANRPSSAPTVAGTANATTQDAPAGPSGIAPSTGNAGTSPPVASNRLSVMSPNCTALPARIADAATTTFGRYRIDMTVSPSRPDTSSPRARRSPTVPQDSASPTAVSRAPIASMPSRARTAGRTEITAHSGTPWRRHSPRHERRPMPISADSRYTPVTHASAAASFGGDTGRTPDASCTTTSAITVIVRGPTIVAAARRAASTSDRSRSVCSTSESVACAHTRTERHTTIAVGSNGSAPRVASSIVNGT